MKLAIFLFSLYLLFILGAAIALILHGHWITGTILAIIAISSKLSISEGKKNDPN